MQTETITRHSPTEACKARVIAIKDKLPTNWREIVVKHYPQYNTLQGSHLLTNVHRGRTADLLVTEILEKIANGKLK